LGHTTEHTRLAAVVSTLILLITVATLVARQQARPAVEVYKSPTCGCCSLWVEHLQANGFTVRTSERDDEALTALKAKHGIPTAARSCHTALVNGYVIEGHVPAADVHRLLKERTAIVGIAVPGMPIGSPGMEVEGRPMQRFDVLTFDKSGQTRVFASHGK
jgi:hypothetical protein